MSDEISGGQAAGKMPFSPAFSRFFLGSVASSAGAGLTGFLISIIAVMSFDADASQMGRLVVFRELPVVVLSLFAGVFIDRISVRKLMMGVVIVLSSLLIAASFFPVGPDTPFTWLYIFVFLIGTATLFKDIGLTTLLPQILPAKQLVHANARLNIANSVNSAAMPVIGGAIIRAVQPVAGLAVAAVFYIVAAISFLRMKETDRQPAQKERLTVAGVFTEIREGLQVLFEVKILRTVMLSSCAGAFGMGIWSALLVLLLVGYFGLEPWAIGRILALASVATVAGSWACPRLSATLGSGPTLILGNVLSTLGIVGATVGATAGLPGPVILGAVLLGTGAPLYSINQIAIRQAMTPAHLMGRANASRRFLVFSFLPLGAFVGGELSNQAGLEAGFGLAALALALATLIALFSPLRNRGFNVHQEVT